MKSVLMKKISEVSSDFKYMMGGIKKDSAANLIGSF